MPSTGRGERRYAKRLPERLPDMIVRGQNLGPALKPQDIYIWLRVLLVLDDAELLEAFAASLTADPNKTYPELHAAEIDAMLAAASEVSRSRLDAWRRRNREMTWLELRALLLGLRATG